jgi:hypothetical protein
MSKVGAIRQMNFSLQTSDLGTRKEKNQARGMQRFHGAGKFSLRRAAAPGVESPSLEEYVPSRKER